MKLYFISGLPRSGSTLLCNVLAQNPNFYATQTNGLIEIIIGIRNQWDKLVEMRAMNNGLSEKRKLSVMQSVIRGFYADVEDKVIFDKSRGWLGHLETLEYVLGEKPKVLVPVRDLRDVLASFEKLWRKSSASRQLNIEENNYVKFQTLEQRLAAWSSYDQPVGLAYNRIKDALQRGWKDSIHFVEYEKFCEFPEQTMISIYDFLGEEQYKHDFNHVKQVTWEDDTMHGFPAKSLHTIRPVIKPQPPQYPEILGYMADEYKGQELW